MHDVEQKRLLFATEGRDHATVQAFTQDLATHGGCAQAIEHVSMDMSAAYLKGVQQQLPQAAICYDRFHVAALAGKAMDEVRAAEFKARPNAVSSAPQGRSNAFVEAMNGLLQNAKRAARGFRTSKNFIAIAYLRMSKLKHLPANPFEHAAPRSEGLLRHRC